MRAEKWTYFPDLFAKADILGIESTVTAEALLESLRSSPPQLLAYGLWRVFDDVPPRQFTTAELAEEERGQALDERWHAIADRLSGLPEDADEAERLELERQKAALEAQMPSRPDLGGGLVERLPRDPHPRPVPRSVWERLERVDGNATSNWQCDEEKPYEFTAVDWLSGSIQMREWTWEPDLSLLTKEYLALRLPRLDAEHLLKKLAELPLAKRGHPRKPRDPWEASEVEKAVAAKRSGDRRRPKELAQAIARRSPKRNDPNLIRRLEEAIKRAL